MVRRTVDLYLGGTLGMWALQQATPNAIRVVFTPDAAIVEAARRLGVEATRADADPLQCEGTSIALSVHYPRILKAPLIARYRALYNLHPSYLPWGRGFYPVFWALWEGTPAGATLHEITEGLDEGPIVAQTRVAYSDQVTGGELHAAVQSAEQRLFLDYWPRIVAGEDLPSSPQPASVGTCHRKEEFFALKRATLHTTSSVDLLRLVRCLTFPGHSGLEVTLGDRRFDLQLTPREIGVDQS